MADVSFASFTFVQKRVGNCFKINPFSVWIFLCLNSKNQLTRKGLDPPQTNCGSKCV